MDGSSTEIQSFYKRKTIFITGASGFMGKVLIEKLLYSCSDLDKIYILLRAKKGCSSDMRLNDMFELPMFQRIRNEKSELFKKVIPLNGDVCSDNFGLTYEQEEHLIKEVNVIFHCAATVRMNAKLKSAIEMNTIGTKRMLDLAKQMKHLQAYVHLSTAFCYIDQQELNESVVDSPHDPEKIMKIIQWLDEEAIDLITSKLLNGHPNTYTYSKRLAERLVANEYPNLPCCIARPSIVTASFSEPMRGWIDSFGGPSGLIVFVGKGAMRLLLCDIKSNAEIIPVDYAINALIIVAYRIATHQKKLENIPVVNITHRNVIPFTWRQILKISIKISQEYPFEGQIWYPGGNTCSNRFVYNLCVLLFHLIPAYLIDFLMLILRRNRFMVKLQSRVSTSLEALEYFSVRNWVFHNTNLLNMYDEISPEDRKIFPCVIYDLDLNEYMKTMILGIRQYCMKEDLSTLPKARRHQTMMYVIHNTVVCLLYFSIFYFIFNNFEIMRTCQDYVIQKVTSLPFVGDVVGSMYGIYEPSVLKVV